MFDSSHQVLAYFGAREHECGAEVREVLAHIERGQLLPPLSVLQQLAKNPSLTLAVVKVTTSSRHLQPLCVVLTKTYCI